MRVCSDKAKICAATDRIPMPYSLVPSFIDLSSLAMNFTASLGNLINQKILFSRPTASFCRIESDRNSASDLKTAPSPWTFRLRRSCSDRYLTQSHLDLNLMAGLTFCARRTRR